MTKVTIKVTKEDIRNGGSYESNCPIAIASRRVLIGVPRVTGKTIDTRGTVIPLPPKAIGFIRSFDNHNRVSPIHFTLEVPDNIARTAITT